MKFLFIIILLLTAASAGPIAVSICYAGCGTLMTACMLAGGACHGTAIITVIAASATLTACNTAFAACMKGCTVAFALLPTP